MSDGGRPPMEALTLKEAASVLLPTGRPRYASVKTLRTRIKEGTLAAELKNGKYVIRVADLESAFQSLSEYERLTAAAQLIIARAESLNEAQREGLSPLVSKALHLLTAERGGR